MNVNAVLLDILLHNGRTVGMMLMSGDYALIYNRELNHISICLPQTAETTTNTVAPVIGRRTDVVETELAVLLQVTKLIFENERTS